MAVQFSSVNVETMAKYLCNVIYLSNREGYLCGDDDTQVYGNAYNALKALLYKEIGANATEYAMNSRTWCCSDFAGQILPAIDEGIEEAALEEKKNRANRMIAYLENTVQNKWSFSYAHYDNGITVYLNNDEEIPGVIPLDWNAVHDFAEKNM